MVFTVFAGLTVCLCCTRRFKTQLISSVACALFTYSTLYASFVYLPMRAEENISKTAPAQAISEYLYNDPLSPEIVCYTPNINGSRIAGLVQFLNPDTKVSYVKHPGYLPQTGIIIIVNGEHIPFSPDFYDIVGVTKEHTILAYGDTARDYIKYKKTSN